MPLVSAKCTNCGAILEVDNSKDAAVCNYCGSAFIVEKAIQNFTINNNIRADVVNVYNSHMNESDLRKDSLNRLKDLHSFFSVKADSYSELDAVNAELIKRSSGPNNVSLWIGMGFILLSLLLILMTGNMGKIVWIASLIIGIHLIGLYLFLWLRNRLRKKQLRAREYKLLEELTEYYASCPDCPFGFEFSHPKDIEHLYDVIRQGRAVSIKEAINIAFHP